MQPGDSREVLTFTDQMPVYRIRFVGSEIAQCDSEPDLDGADEIIQLQNYQETYKFHSNKHVVTNKFTTSISYSKISHGQNGISKSPQRVQMHANDSDR